MKKKNLLLIYILTSAIILFASGNNEFIPEEKVNMEKNVNHEIAVFAGGCFWGVEAVFESLKGVYNVESGYSGGSADTAFYKRVGTGKTGHAEAVRMDFNPEVISYNELLDVFFNVAHNPTELNFQGPDYGTEYRSAVFYTNEEQEDKVNNYVKKMTLDKVFDAPIVTEVVPLDGFYSAEEYHQDFLRLNPTHPYIVYWDIPKLEMLDKKYPKLTN